MIISPSHPRFRSLQIRERLAREFKAGIVASQGLIAHGRGEAFDYLLGEKTPKSSIRATNAAAALLLSARKPIISVNGNAAALVPREIVGLARSIPAELEVNLFHRTQARERKIASLLKRNGAKLVLGVDQKNRSLLKGVASSRRLVDSRGIGNADVVLIPLEDGDRAEALRDTGKRVIAIDLNPMSRTSRAATVTIVDNILRAMPALVRATSRMKHLRKSRLSALVRRFDNDRNLKMVTKEMIQYLRGWT